jgi:DNA-directed RNA polymerase subunit RPC12/RpoP
MESVAKHARRTWEEMLSSCGEHDKLTHQKFGVGFLYVGTVSGAIRKVSKEVTGHDCDNTRVKMVREFLRYSHNVVVLEKVKDYTHKIFIRAEWNEGQTAVLLAGGERDNSRPENWFERKVTPEEAGETMKPEPVKKEWECKQCGERFDSTPKLARHAIDDHTDTDRTYVCKHCGQEFDNPNALGGHTRSKHPVVSYVCDECGADMETNFKLVHHKRLAHGEVECEVCGRKIGNELSLVKHMKRAHGVDKPDQPDKPTAINAVQHDDNAIVMANKIRHHLQDAERQVAKLVAMASKADDKSKGKLDIIADIITDVESGKCSPLKALSDISEALRL